MNKFLTFTLALGFCGLTTNVWCENSAPVKAAAAAPTNSSTAKESPMVVFETTQGNIEFKLFPEAAPKTCENFLGLIGKKYYDGVVFHRIIKDFMIQGGDPTGTGRGGQSLWGKPFEDEVREDIKFDRKGILAMANAGPGTNGSQFFITTVPTPWLNMHHTIFGEVAKGYEVIQKLEAVKTAPGDKPVETQKIIKAYVKK